LVKDDEKEALALLRLKLNSKIHFGRTSWRDGGLYVSVEPKYASNLKALSGKVTLGGNQLLVDFAHEKGPGKVIATDRIEKLNQMVRSRYDQQTMFLNLDGIVRDPLFKETGIDGFTQSTAKNSSLGRALCRIIQQNCPNVNHIDPGENDISCFEWY
jgi:hypothetical protein